jgi:thiamine transport system substrate-binding protein
MRAARPIVIALALALAMGAAAACGGDDDTASSTTVDSSHPGGTVVLMAHDSFAVSKPVLQAFERATGTKVKLLKGGDAGVVLNQAILTKDHPEADAFFGVDNTFLSRALDHDVFVPYTAKGLPDVGQEFVLDPAHRVTPVDYGDICLNYDKTWFGHDGRPAAPTSMADLVAPAYKGLTVVEDPAQSSPGLGFLIATIEKYGDQGWEYYWQRLRANDVLVDDGWEQAYNGDFTAGGGGGKRPIVVSYASSPPADVVYADPPKQEPAIAAVLSSCFRQVEFVGVLHNAAHPVQAQRLVDFMISDRFQRDVPLSMFVYPVRRGTPLPDVFEKFGPLAMHPYEPSPAEIGKHRDEWLAQWADVMHR